MRSFAEQWETLIRGIDAVVPEVDFRKKLEQSIAKGRPLRVKYGIDPTGIDVHLGHTVPLRKLRQFQELGHTAVIIIGDYTAMVGDPSGRDAARTGLTREQVEANAKDYLQQVGRIIDLEKAEVHHNGDWFGKWAFLDVLRLMQRTTIGKISAREDFAKRIHEEKPVYLSECLYPLMQGWDSVEIRADVELGGTEQLFNLLVGRDLQQEERQSPQVAMTLPILVGTDGTRRMGKSLGNYIGVGEDANAQFGKIMSLPDEPMRHYFTLLTDIPIAEVNRLLSAEVNPRDAKDALGRTIVAYYHGQEAAEAASSEFRKRSKGEDPEEIPETTIEPRPWDEKIRAQLVRLVGEAVAIEEIGIGGAGAGEPLAVTLPNLLVAAGFETSTSKAREAIKGGGASIGPNKIIVKSPFAFAMVQRTGPILLFDEGVGNQPHRIPRDQFVVRCGKRRIKRIKFSFSS